jgi:squalene-hopene/tetraprenyl-beta-curcumene cyclase
MTFNIAELDKTIDRAVDRLFKFQKRIGAIQFPLEADCTLTSDYILLGYFNNNLEKEELEGYVNYLLHYQNDHDGSWSLYTDGAGDLSCTVRCYFALKVAAEYVKKAEINKALARAKYFIINHGGAEKSNVFTLVKLALFRQIPWEALPWFPTEAILLPTWFPFNYYKVSYWTRVTYATLSLLVYFKPQPKKLHIDVQELFVHNPWTYKKFLSNNLNWRGKLLLKAERVLAAINNFLGRPLEVRGAAATLNWIKERANPAGGLGAIYPSMENWAIICTCDYQSSTSDGLSRTREAYDNLYDLRSKIPNVGDFIQPCISPVWDTAIALMALNELGNLDTPRVKKAIQYLLDKQISTVGDWSINTDLPQFPKNGWAFQDKNDFYPDVDDTAMVIKALEPHDGTLSATRQAKAWLAMMQSKNGGFAAFDVDNTSKWLNWLPFADHGAMIDPPTVDVSGRALAALAGSEELSPRDQARLVKYILKEQDNGLWWGRWGNCWTWGTWSVVMGLCKIKITKKIRKALLLATNKLQEMQNTDGGYGENLITYETSLVESENSNAFNSSLVLLTLCEIYENKINQTQSIKTTINKLAAWLINNQLVDGSWPQSGHNAPGFPKTFYLKYHGYAIYFPLWALAKYKNLKL